MIPKRQALEHMLRSNIQKRLENAIKRYGILFSNVVRIPFHILLARKAFVGKEDRTMNVLCRNYGSGEV